MPAIAAALGLGVAAVVGLSVLSACAPGARRAQYRAQVHCAGQRYIEVRNGLVVPATCTWRRSRTARDGSFSAPFARVYRNYRSPSRSTSPLRGARTERLSAGRRYPFGTSATAVNQAVRHGMGHVAGTFAFTWRRTTMRRQRRDL